MRARGLALVEVGAGVRVRSGDAIVRLAHLFGVWDGRFPVGLRPPNALGHLVVRGSNLVAPAVHTRVGRKVVVHVGEQRVALLERVRRLVARALCNRPTEAAIDAGHTACRVHVVGPLLALSRRTVRAVHARCPVDREAVCVVNAHTILAGERSRPELVGGVAIGMLGAKVALHARPTADAAGGVVGGVRVALLVANGEAVVVSALVVFGADLPVAGAHVV